MAASSGVRLAGDVVRFCAVLSLVGAATTWKAVAAALFALVLLGLTLLRLLVSPSLDLATGLGAAALHQTLVRVGVLPGADAPYPRRAALGAAVVLAAVRDCRLRRTGTRPVESRVAAR